MALSKSDKPGSNVSNLDEARALRADSSSEPDRKDSSITDRNDGDQSAKKAQKVSNRRFDTVKVERIKGEIARGEYKIDYLHVADKFIEHERYS